MQRSVSVGCRSQEQVQTDHLCCHVFVTKMCDCHVHEGGIAESIAPCICLPLAGADPSESLWHQVPNITGWWPWLELQPHLLLRELVRSCSRERNNKI
ncbi:uncharacterized protein ACIBXB_019047 isoform 3-T6 [Morphnus guianensis]